MTTRIGPRMRELRDYVSAVPGCSKAQALRGVGLPDRGLGAYRPIDRTIGAGLMISEQTSRCGPFRLFASDLDRRLWHLRRELLDGPSADRCAEILAEADKIRAEQAAAYAKETAR